MSSYRGVVPLLFALAFCGAIRAAADEPRPPEGFTALFDGKDLTGFKGLVKDPVQRAAMTAEQLTAEQAVADERMRDHWKAIGGELVFDGGGDNICTAKDYANFELYVDWKIGKGGDSGIYLRGTPQVQIWDPQNDAAEGTGSGGLYNNERGPNKPLAKADNPVGEWNTFYIKMIGDRVTVKLNGQLVVDDVPLENYWDRSKPIFSTGAIELQNHGSTLYFRNLYVKELAP